jgi:hypothetical protein
MDQETSMEMETLLKNLELKEKKLEELMEVVANQDKLLKAQDKQLELVEIEKTSLEKKVVEQDAVIDEMTGEVEALVIALLKKEDGEEEMGSDEAFSDCSDHVFYANENGDGFRRDTDGFDDAVNNFEAEARREAMAFFKGAVEIEGTEEMFEASRRRLLLSLENAREEEVDLDDVPGSDIETTSSDENFGDESSNVDDEINGQGFNSDGVYELVHLENVTFTHFRNIRKQLKENGCDISYIHIQFIGKVLEIGATIEMTKLLKRNLKTSKLNWLVVSNANPFTLKCNNPDTETTIEQRAIKRLAKAAIQPSTPSGWMAFIGHLMQQYGFSEQFKAELINIDKTTNNFGKVESASGGCADDHSSTDSKFKTLNVETTNLLIKQAEM